jgi:hypothetical protein
VSYRCVSPRGVVQIAIIRYDPNVEGHDELTSKIIGAAIEVHRHLGPGLLESTYEQCLSWELRDAGLAIERQTLIPIVYEGHLAAGVYATHQYPHRPLA